MRGNVFGNEFMKAVTNETYIWLIPKKIRIYKNRELQAFPLGDKFIRSWEWII